ncbi:mas-related G-protein coupled receptor member X2-like [Perognathus longimembris pacificus]|uniref:mas-related G-protein coupled receptor member X2-like n=1 Tax=Perognathus longimembris pacificus TaxID=214514 RepID=UPI002018D530|nr:mas-related G-protein coupled receptor member X2-like [Perognathus longimembris pacificus]
MEEMTTNGEFLSKDTTIPALKTEVPNISEDGHLHGPCALEELILNSLTFIVAVVGMAGNAAVLWLLGFRMRRKAISVYILNLAAADFLFLCFNFLNSIQDITSLITHIHSHLFNFFSSGFFCSYTASLSFLSAISLERCLSVVCPIWYRCRRPRHTSIFVCLLIWALSLLLTILRSYHCIVMNSLHLSNWCLRMHSFSAGYLTLLLVALSGSSLAIIIKMFCGSGRMPMTRLYVTVLLTVLVFIFCGLPYGIRYSLKNWFYVNDQNISCFFFLLLFFLSCVNSCANPIIYFFVGSFRQQRRKTLKWFLQRALQDTTDDECVGSVSRGALEMSGNKEAEKSSDDQLLSWS